MIEPVGCRSTVLVTGESGTGKVGRACDPRSESAEPRPLSRSTVARSRNAPRIRNRLLREAIFAGANANRKGLFEAANLGTIFLDEIGEMSGAMQVKLLRVLQERKLRPSVPTDETVVDTRVIAATNRDPARMVHDGTFREDLFYRISVIPIELPPLRETAEDIQELAEHFVQKFCAQAGRTLSLSEKALRLLENYSWPGNVRELEHTIERAVALEHTEAIQPERLPEKITNYDPQRIAAAFDLPDEGVNLTAYLDQLERTYVLEALRRKGGNQTSAAELLRLSVRSLRHLLDKHDIRGLTAQMRDERRDPDSPPRRRSTDVGHRRREDDTGEFVAGAGE